MDKKKDGHRTEIELPRSEARRAPETSPLESEPDRRTFLKAAGFSLGTALLPNCQPAPVHEVIPYLTTPEEVAAGKPLFYASTCGACSAACGTLVRVVDGRPIKLDGNPDHPLSRGALCAVGQGSIVELYDSRRLRAPLIGGAETSWRRVDEFVRERLEQARLEEKNLYLITGTIHSPSLQSVIGRWLNQSSNHRWVQYDTIPASAIAAAHQETHLLRRIPHYEFGRAEVIVSLDADFLGTWISPVELTQGYRDGRTLEGSRLRFSTHFHFESRFSLTGTQADTRYVVAPEEHLGLLASLAHLLADKRSTTLPFAAPRPSSVPMETLSRIATALWNARGKSLIVCGINDPELQILVNAINELLGNYGRTLDLFHPSRQKEGDEAALAPLLEDLEEDRVGVLLCAGANPVYDLPFGERIARPPGTVLRIDFASHLDETARISEVVCPPHHFLETWSDAAPTNRVVSLQQPVISPLGSTRSLGESLSRWMGIETTDYEVVRDYWSEEVFSRRFGFGEFEEFWAQSVHDGVARVRPVRETPSPFNDSSLLQLAVPSELSRERPLTLLAYPPNHLFDGSHAMNPWLLELPDPVSKVSWENFLSLAPETAAELGLEEGELARLDSEGGVSIELPVLLQPGQHERVAAVALGYGREGSERFRQVGPQWLEARFRDGTKLGERAGGFIRWENGRFRFDNSSVRLSGTGRKKPLIRAQKHSQPRDLDGRSAIRHLSFKALISTPPSPPSPPEAGLWDEDHRYTGHHWGMVIDLGACTGCSACVVACQAENNIPVVGPDEVLRDRNMHWIRIDRYYEGRGKETRLAFQPMLCQQCDHAPCESVCPVLATVHSRDGLNQQIYNRCVGTRYCSNNCPYKVRAFNWFDYSAEARLENLQLNPRVTVRERGVMEKCTFCVQRIQEARIDARMESRAIEDGAIRPACEETCPARAITFGDLNEPGSRVSALLKSPRGYKVLEELGVRPSVTYLAVVRNEEQKGGADESG